MTTCRTWMLLLTGILLAGCAGDTLESPKVRMAGSEPAAESFQVTLATTRGAVGVEVFPGWAPNGAAGFRELVEEVCYEGSRIFRVDPDFVVQFGINGDPAVHSKWDTKIPDDPVTESNLRGTLTFATSGPNTRTTQLFINLKNNSSSLDGQGFSPFGRVVSGMEFVDAMLAECGEGGRRAGIGREGGG